MNRTVQQFEERMDAIYNVFKKIEVLVDSGKVDNVVLSTILAEAQDGKFQTVRALDQVKQDLLKGFFYENQSYGFSRAYNFSKRKSKRRVG